MHRVLRGKLKLGTPQLWLGTDLGIVLRSTDPNADPPWRYLYGPRWHPGRSITALVADKRPLMKSDLAATAGTSTGTIFAATDGGLVFLELQVWTLEKKAVSGNVACTEDGFIVLRTVVTRA